MITLSRRIMLKFEKYASSFLSLSMSVTAMKTREARGKRGIKKLSQQTSNHTKLLPDLLLKIYGVLTFAESAEKFGYVLLAQDSDTACKKQFVKAFLDPFTSKLQQLQK
uniref:(northern house mosquito) hypothetical protein n=1 Tax=Culex pipiens TaxID=7175 RepID=A0A8D8H1S3_CULPI